MKLANLPNWQLRQKLLFIFGCWTVFSIYYYVKNQFEIPPLDVRELLGSLPVFALAAHGTFFFLNRFVAQGRVAVGLVGMLGWYIAVFFLAHLIVNWINPNLPLPFMDGEYVPITNPAFVNMTVTSLVNFSVVGLVFFLIYRAVSYANAQRLAAEGKLAAMRRQAHAEAEAERYEYLALAGQVSPHFIINMLLDWESKLGSDNKSEATSMQQMYALLLYHARAKEPGYEVVPLQVEIDQLLTFITLLRNTNNNVFINTEIDGNAAGYTIPPTTLIALVDNAYKHGVTDEKDNPVQLKLVISNHIVWFNCSNKVKKAGDPASHGIGLANAKRRLGIQYGHSYILNIQEHDGHFSLELSIKF